MNQRQQDIQRIAQCRTLEQFGAFVEEFMQRPDEPGESPPPYPIINDYNVFDNFKADIDFCEYTV